MKHCFVEFIPEKLEPDTLYISLDYNLVVHKCASGCGNDVVTPLSPAEWSLTYDGHSVSLYPSVGNWNLPCRSHYWIRNGEIHWAETWDHRKIRAAQQRDLQAKQLEYGGDVSRIETKAAHSAAEPVASFIERLRSMFRKITGG